MESLDVIVNSGKNYEVGNFKLETFELSWKKTYFQPAWLFKSESAEYFSFDVTLISWKNREVGDFKLEKKLNFSIRISRIGKGNWN